MEEKEIKTFKIDNIRVPDKDGNLSGNHYAGYKGSLTIKIGQPKISSLGTYTLNFSTKIPDHVHELLNNQTIERQEHGIGRSEQIKNNYKDMPKTINAGSLEGLVNYYNKIINDYLWVINDKKQPKKKMIFILFKRTNNGFGSYNGADAGGKAISRWSYFIGYDNGQTLFDINQKHFNTLQDKELLEYKKVEWTEEREFFIRKLTEQLEQAMQNVSNYIDQISDEKIIDQLMLSDKKLLG
jgi:hypothetical protein